MDSPKSQLREKTSIVKDKLDVVLNVAEKIRSTKTELIEFLEKTKKEKVEILDKKESEINEKIEAMKNIVKEANVSVLEGSKLRVSNDELHIILKLMVVILGQHVATHIFCM